MELRRIVGMGAWSFSGTLPYLKNLSAFFRLFRFARIKHDAVSRL